KAADPGLAGLAIVEEGLIGDSPRLPALRAHDFQRSLTYRIPRPDGSMHHRTTSSVPSGRGVTHGSPKEKSPHSVCSPDVPVWVGVGARQTISFASMPKSVSVSRTTASQTPGSPWRRWL